MELIKVAVIDIPPITLAWGRVALAALLLYAVLKLRKGSLPTDRRTWAFLAVFGVFGNVLPFVLINWGGQRIDAGLSSILMAVMPLVTIVLAHFLTTGEPLTLRRIIGILVGFGGVVVLVGPEVLSGLGGDALHQLAVTGAAVCYAIGAIVARWLPPMEDYTRGAGILIVSAVMLAPAMLVLEQPLSVRLSLDAGLALGYMAIFPTALATIFLFWVIERRGATFLALNNYLIRGLGVFWGWLLLNEGVDAQKLMALALILGGITLAGSGSRRLT